MARLSDLAAANPIDGSETVPLVQGGVTRRAHLSKLAGRLPLPDYEAREAIPVGQRSYGLEVYVESDGNTFVWRKAGDPDVAGLPLASDEWVYQYPPHQLKNLAIDPAGILPKAHVEGLPDGLADVAALYAPKISGLRARALSSATHPITALDWQIKGAQPDSQTLSWGGYSLTLDGRARGFTTRDQSITTGLAFATNSLGDETDNPKWPSLLAAEMGVPIVANVGRYSSDARQKYRLGAASIVLTVSDNTVPATGSPGAAVPLINGVAPSNNADPYSLGGNPGSFLNTGDAALTTGVSMDGYIGDAPVRVSIPNAASTAYKIIQTRPGAGALVLGGPAVFTPAPSFEFVNRTVVVWMGNNYFYSGQPGEFADYTNPQFRVDLAEIVSWLQSRGNRVILLPIIPDSAWPRTGAGNPYAAHLAANAHTEAAYPTLYAGGLLAALQSAGNGGTNDNADVAAGLVPRSLHVGGDTLHLNAAGDVVVKNYVTTFMAAQTLPPLLTQSSEVELFVTATQPGTGVLSTDRVTVRLTRDPLADLSDLIDDARLAAYPTEPEDLGISTAQAAALAPKAPLASPAFTGTPTAPTAAPGTNTSQIATTAFTKAAIDALTAAAPGALDTLAELAAALGDDANFAATITAAIAKRAETYVQDTEPVTTAPALWLDTSNAGFVTLNIQRGA